MRIYFERYSQRALVVAYKVARFARNRASIWGYGDARIVAICRMTGVRSRKTVHAPWRAWRGAEGAMDSRWFERASEQAVGQERAQVERSVRKRIQVDGLSGRYGIGSPINTHRLYTADVLFLTRCELFLELVLLSR